jgi:CRISPR-associated protein Cas5d
MNDWIVEFEVWGRFALFTDPLTKVGGEKSSYDVPTYEALKGIAKSIYWKPTLTWYIEAVRVMQPIATQTKGTKPLEFGGGNTLAIYTYLSDVRYQVKARFAWNRYRPEFEDDRNFGKHRDLAERSLERGGRQDIFLGTRDCQGYAAVCAFGSGSGHYDGAGMVDLGLMFHGFDYPDETGDNSLVARFWEATMNHGVLTFPTPEQCSHRKFIREVAPKTFIKN